MSDAAVTVLVSGLVQVMVLVMGFLTLWVKLKYGVEEARDAAGKAEKSAILAAAKVEDVEAKLAANTAMTDSVNIKADTIVSQTNGNIEQMAMLIKQVAERVDKLEDYNRLSSHRVLDAINTIHLKVAVLVAVQEKLLGGKLSIASPKQDNPEAAN